MSSERELQSRIKDRVIQTEQSFLSAIQTRIKELSKGVNTPLLEATNKPFLINGPDVYLNRVKPNLEFSFSSDDSITHIIPFPSIRTFCYLGNSIGINEYEGSCSVVTFTNNTKLILRHLSGFFPLDSMRSISFLEDDNNELILDPYGFKLDSKSLYSPEARLLAFTSAKQDKMQRRKDYFFVLNVPEGTKVLTLS